MNPATEIQNPIFKAGTAWALVGVSSWADAASMASFVAAVVAGLYSLLLLTEWWWKKVWRPLLVRLGYLPEDRRRGEYQQQDDDNEQG